MRGEHLHVVHNDNPRQALAPGDGGPHDPGMETRVAKLEADMAEIKGILARLEPAITKIRDDMMELKGRVSQLPTTFQLLGMIVGIFGAVFAVFGGALAILRFMTHT